MTNTLSPQTSPNPEPESDGRTAFIARLDALIRQGDYVETPNGGGLPSPEAPCPLRRRTSPPGWIHGLSGWNGGRFGCSSVRRTPGR
jgi:hypothetical protein